jgi:hypothetical protein
VGSSAAQRSSGRWHGRRFALIEAAVGESGVAHDLFDEPAGVAVAVEEAPGGLEDFSPACGAFASVHSFVPRRVTIVAPKDDLAIFWRSTLTRAANLVVRAPGAVSSSHDERAEACCPDYRCIIRHRPGNRRAAGGPGLPGVRRRPCSRNHTSARGRRARAARRPRSPLMID